MDVGRFQEYMEAAFRRVRELNGRKGKDYRRGAEDDAFANFRRAAATLHVDRTQDIAAVLERYSMAAANLASAEINDLMQVTPAMVWFVYAAKHWDAITSYVLGIGTESEPIQSRLDDLILYALLLGASYAGRDDLRAPWDNAMPVVDVNGDGPSGPVPRSPGDEPVGIGDLSVGDVVQGGWPAPKATPLEKCTVCGEYHSEPQRCVLAPEISPYKPVLRDVWRLVVRATGSNDVEEHRAALARIAGKLRGAGVE